MLILIAQTASFSCPLVHNLPYCPGISYPVPLPAPPFPFTAHEASTIPTTVSGPLLEYLTNFTVALSTFPCGRDQYSPITTCADCQAAYRTWLCSVQFTRCSEAPSTASSSDTAIQPKLVEQKPGEPRRNPNLPAKREAFSELLPCLETCQAVERACPYFMGFKCPVVRFNAGESYAVGYVDSGKEGEEGGGSTGAAQDQWGNVWCNAGS
jgi:calcium channel MID1